MGLACSTELESQNLEEDMVFWSSVVELGLAGISATVVGPFQCDLPLLKHELRKVASNDEILCRKRVNHKGKPLRTFPLSNTGADFSVKFLAWSPALANARHRLVPGRVSEEIFWTNFFEAIRVVVILQYLHCPSTAAYKSNFELAHSLLDEFAWLPEQVIDKARHMEFRHPNSVHSKIDAIQKERQQKYEDILLT
eukprot:1181082-Prorocentrum_minimum.AAC.5